MKCVILVVVLAAAVQASPLASSPVHRIATLPPIPGAPIYPSPRIVNGQRATRGQFPHQAAVVIDSSAFCGGSLIHPEWVLTAGHCVVGAKNWLVTLGQQQQSANEDGRVTQTSTNGILHENYQASTLTNDVALIKLSPVQLSQWIKVIALPRQSDSNNDFTGAAVTASGWGKDSDAATSVSDQLNFVNLHVISNPECAQTYGSATITAGKLCCGAPGGISTCNGDSGGPLISGDQKFLVGVTSFVSSLGCASGAPSGFSRATTYSPWIREKTGIPPQE